MAFTHYLDAIIRMPEIVNEIHGRLLYMTHKIIREESHYLGVTWPDMHHDTFGFVLRVFGNVKSLSAYASACAPLIERGIIRLYPIMEIPNYAVYNHHIARDRRNEKNTVGFQKRQATRRERRGVAPHQPKQVQEEGRNHFLQVQSGSTGQIFSIHLKRMKGVAPDGAGGKNYGLGITLPSF